ncbi:metallophosphoesterase family protein [Lentibacillus sediminis]|uniref:metallophosphoesterase family protein n=1 Tax=Lentibacillus sediminis TaxID=1940529 RepID=UPI000C1BB040|nr:DNA repair exonuclease [Lentibacillus sediminis]
MSKEISFIHAADLHLDSPFMGLAAAPGHIFEAIRESTFTALKRLVQAAIEKNVDFMIIAGDLFDQERQSLKAQIRLRQAFETLKRHDIQVYLSYGNHDYLNGGSHAVTYPENVHVFPGENISSFTHYRDGEPVAAVYGFSYENRAVTGNKTNDYVIGDEEIPFHIATLHGSLHTNTEHDMYAPFQLSDLTAKDFDYWALGHIHQRQMLKNDPPIVYPGNIQGRSRKESGEKGCYHVVLSKQGGAPHLEFVPLAPIQFVSVTADVSGCKEAYQLEEIIQQELEKAAQRSSRLVNLTLTSDNPTLKQWEQERALEDVIDLVNESNAKEQDWQYIFRSQVELYSAVTEGEASKGEHFIGELSRHFDEVSIRPFLEDLYKQKQARKHLRRLTDEEEARIKTEARQLLLNELLSSEG